MKKKTTPRIVTAYQYGEHGHFIGQYQFEKNLDKEELHLPPRTTLLAPPNNLPPDKTAHFEKNRWTVRSSPMPWLPEHQLPKTEEAAHGN